MILTSCSDMVAVTGHKAKTSTTTYFQSVDSVSINDVVGTRDPRADPAKSGCAPSRLLKILATMRSLSDSLRHRIDRGGDGRMRGADHRKRHAFQLRPA